MNHHTKKNNYLSMLISKKNKIIADLKYIENNSNYSEKNEIYAIQKVVEFVKISGKLIPYSKTNRDDFAILKNIVTNKYFLYKTEKDNTIYFDSNYNILIFSYAKKLMLNKHCSSNNSEIFNEVNNYIEIMQNQIKDDFKKH